MSNNTASRTEEIIAAIVTTSHTHRIAPALFSHCFGRAHTSAAFRLAKSRGLIEVAYISCAGSPVYKLTAAAHALVAVEGVAQ